MTDYEKKNQSLKLSVFQRERVEKTLGSKWKCEHIYKIEVPNVSRQTFFDDKYTYCF